MQQDDSFTRVIGWIARLRIRSQTVTGVWLVGALLFLVALAVRLDLDSPSQGDPFATFDIALVAITLCCGWRRALCFAGLAAIAAWYFFLRTPVAPDFVPPAAGPTLISLAGFAAVAATEIAVAETLAMAAAALTGGGARDRHMQALRRRASTAVAFVAQPAKETNGMRLDTADLLEETRARHALFDRLEASVLDATMGEEDWAARMEALCRALLAEGGQKQPVCRITGDVAGLEVDRLLAVSLTIADMARQCIDARCGVFEAVIQNDKDGVCTLDVRTTGCRPPRWEMPGGQTWSAATRWLTHQMDGRLTVSADGEPGLRFEMPG